MGFVKRRASTKAKVLIENFEQVKAQFLLDVRAVAEVEDIPFDLIINWNQTGIHYVPVGSWTIDKEGSKRVEIAGVDDNHSSVRRIPPWRFFTFPTDLQGYNSSMSTHSSVPFWMAYYVQRKPQVK